MTLILRPKLYWFPVFQHFQHEVVCYNFFTLCCWLSNDQVCERGRSCPRESRDKNRDRHATDNMCVAMRGHSTMFFSECQITPDWLGHVRTEQFEQNGWPTGFPIQSWNSLPATCGKWLSPFHWWHRPVCKFFLQINTISDQKILIRSQIPMKKILIALVVKSRIFDLSQ